MLRMTDKDFQDPESDQMAEMKLTTGFFTTQDRKSHIK